MPATFTRLGSEYGGWDVALEAIPPGSTVLDLGVGNDTTFAEALQAIQEQTFIFVDPSQASGEHIQTRGFKDWKFICAAAAKFNGPAHLFKNQNDGGSDSLRDDNLNNSWTKVLVPAVKLKELIDFHQPSLVKMDVEGSEFDLWDDCIGVPQIAIEFHERLLSGKTERHKFEIVGRLAAHGYVPYIVDESITFLRA